MKRIGVYIIALLISATAFGQSVKKYVREGNRNFEEKEYEESEVSYRKAINKEADLFDANFNLGDALYKQEKFDEAATKFDRLTNRVEGNKELAKAYHNLGNSLLKSQKIEQSIAAYKSSLRNYPGDQETKYNLSYAKDLLKEQQQKKDQKQNKDQENNKDKQEQDKENQDQQEKDQQEQNKNEQQKDKQKQQKQPQKISKEDANRLLNALANDEKKIQEKVKKAKAKMQKVKTEKDW